MTELPVLDLRDPAFTTDRYGTIEALRAQAPAFRTPEGAVVFLNQAECAEVLACRNFRFAFNQIDGTASPYLANAIENELLNMHGARHERLSRLLKQALRDRVFDGMAVAIEGIVAALIDAMPDNGEIDLCTDFADPLPARVLGPMFGIPYEDTAGLNDWIRTGGRKVDALQSGVDIEEVEAANRNIHDFLRGLIRDRRARPGDDLLSELIAAEIDGDRMREDELVYLGAELASAGVDTTRAQLPLIVADLVLFETEQAKLRADPGLALRAVDEGMRFSPLPWALPHAATRDHATGGVDFRTGDLAFVLVPAANRDPAVVDQPNSFRIDRDRVRHFAFGWGMHACPGSQLARMEMAAALRALFTRLARIELAEAAWEPGAEGRTLRSLRLAVAKG